MTATKRHLPDDCSPGPPSKREKTKRSRLDPAEKTSDKPLTPRATSLRGTTSSATTMALRAPPHVPCKHLFDLPQELIDMIFDLAYHRPHGLMLSTRHLWSTINKSHSWPGSQVSRFLVSRAFLENASRAFIQPHTMTSRLFATGNFQSSVIARFVARIVVRPSELWLLDILSSYTFPNLTELTIAMGYYHLPGSRTRLLKNTEFVQFEVYSNLLAIRYVPNIKLSATPMSSLNEMGPGSQALWKSNAQQFGCFIERILMHDKPSDGNQSLIRAWRQQRLDHFGGPPGESVQSMGYFFDPDQIPGSRSWADLEAEWIPIREKLGIPSMQ